MICRVQWPMKTCSLPIVANDLHITAVTFPHATLIFNTFLLELHHVSLNVVEQRFSKMEEKKRVKKNPIIYIVHVENSKSLARCPWLGILQQSRSKTKMLEREREREREREERSVKEKTLQFPGT